MSYAIHNHSHNWRLFFLRDKLRKLLTPENKNEAPDVKGTRISQLVRYCKENIAYIKEGGQDVLVEALRSGQFQEMRAVMNGIPDCRQLRSFSSGQIQISTLVCEGLTAALKNEKNDIQLAVRDALSILKIVDKSDPTAMDIVYDSNSETGKKVVKYDPLVTARRVLDFDNPQVNRVTSWLKRRVARSGRSKFVKWLCR